MPEKIETKIADYYLRFAQEEDITLILEFIKDLARYEKMLDDVSATKKLLTETLFEKEVAEVIIAEYKDEAVGFAVFFHNMSTFLAKPGLYIEDIFIKPEMRGKGFGKTIFAYIANLAKERNCGRLEWSCLDWNQPAIDFYESIGAEALDEWIGFRLTEDKIKDLAQEF